MKKEQELKTKTMDELVKLEAEFKSDLSKLNFKHAMGQLEKTSEILRLRKEVARVKTFIRQKELEKVSNAKAN